MQGRPTASVALLTVVSLLALTPGAVGQEGAPLDGTPEEDATRDEAPPAVPEEAPGVPVDEAPPAVPEEAPGVPVDEAPPGVPDPQAEDVAEEEEAPGVDVPPEDAPPADPDPEPATAEDVRPDFGGTLLFVSAVLIVLGLLAGWWVRERYEP